MPSAPNAPDPSPYCPLARSRRQRLSIHEDGVEIGRLYADLQASRPENRWFWCIQVMGPARFRVRIDSRAATLEQAKADFLTAWAAFKAANVSH
jgi:hypothetical protein